MEQTASNGCSENGVVLESLQVPACLKMWTRPRYAQSLLELINSVIESHEKFLAKCCIMCLAFRNPRRKWPNSSVLVWWFYACTTLSDEEYISSLHADCDWLLKYYDTRKEVCLLQKEEVSKPSKAN